MKIITRKEAKLLGLKHYFTGKPCKYGHVGDRYVSMGRCKICSNTDAIEWQRVHPEENKAFKRARYWANPGKARQRGRDYAKRNPDKVKATFKRWREVNLEREQARLRAYHKAHPDKTAFHCSKRRAQKLNATPKWLTQPQLRQIEAFYTSAHGLTKQTGIMYHVDHIHPLHGKGFNGLHVPWNLQVIPAVENQQKHNNLTIESI